MIKREHLHLLIDDVIYPIDELPDSGNSASLGRSEVRKDKTEKQENMPHETPQLNQKTAVPKVDLAVFHESVDTSDTELLQNIIDACKLDTHQYQIFDNGFEKDVVFEKALVFVSKAKVYYEAVTYQNSKILCARPLHELRQNQEEKLKLWKALQKFI